MKILCLHGKGTSGSIFKSQTANFRNRLPKSLNLEFDFVNGPCTTSPAPGVDLFYPPPYYAFWQNDSTDSIAGARKWLADYIARNGPYDAIMMFSQGCALGASFLLHHEKETPHLPAPFKAAIFICGGTVLADLEGLGFEVPEAVRERDVKSRLLLSTQADASAILTSGSQRWTGFDKTLTGNEGEWRSEIRGRPCQISIPTVHVYGEKDPRYVAGVQLSGLCDPGNRHVYNHRGGHEIPRMAVVSSTITELVSEVLENC